MTEVATDDVDSSLRQAVAHHQQGNLEAASVGYRTILAQHPRHFDATHLLGVIALQEKRFDAAQSLISAALLENPEDITAVTNLGTAYMRDGQPDAAMTWFDLALKLEPDHLTALINMGTALQNLGRLPEAVTLLRRAHAHHPTVGAVQHLLGGCLLKSGAANEAAEILESALRHGHETADAWANLAIALNALGEHARGAECAERALRLQPLSRAALRALGVAQVGEGRLMDAIATYRQCVELPGASVDLLFEFANALLSGGFNEEAIVHLERALELDETNMSIRWAIAMAHIKPIYRDVSDIDATRQRFETALNDVRQYAASVVALREPHLAVGMSQPFYLAYQPFNNGRLLAKYGDLCASWMGPLLAPGKDAPNSTRPIDSPPDPNRKLQVGIVSAHIHEHSVWNAIGKGWVHHLDPNKFELHLFQLGTTSDNETEEAKLRVASMVAHPTNLVGWIHAIREKRLDALIYPEIGMDPLTLRLAALRLAPVQAAAWGHPETTGLPTMDYYISAEGFEPPDGSANYRERLIRLPNLGVHVTPLAPARSKPGLRSLELPDDEALLLCAGTPFKYSPLYDDVWVSIARQMPRKRFLRSRGGKLVFFRSRSVAMDELLEKRLRAAFERGGISFDENVRVIASLERSRFFGLMRRSALMLDTLGFSGFNTALQAIQCDLPVVAFEGDYMRGRLASAIMRRLGLDELVATTPEEFVLKTVELVTDAGRRRRLRAQIIERRHILYGDLAPIRALERELTQAVAASAATLVDRLD